MPRLPGQRGPAAAVRARLQLGQLPAQPRAAERGGEMVAHDLAREACEDRRPDRAPRAVRGLPARGSGGAADAVRRDPAPDRAPARTARGGGLTGADHGTAEAEGEPCAEIDQEHQNSPDRPADGGPVAPRTRDPPSTMRSD